MTGPSAGGRHGYTTARRARPSSARPRAWKKRQACRILLTLALVAVARPAAAQDTTHAAQADSLEERLKRAEEAIELLRKQLGAQAASAVQTRSRVQMELSGQVVLNGFSNSHLVNVVDVPQFVLFSSLTGGGGTLRRYGGGSAGLAVRQSQIGLAVTVGQVLGGSFVGDLDVDLFGGAQSNASRTFPLVRLRTARGFLRWSHAEVMAGAETPLLADLNPVSLSSIGTPEFALAGNLWFWLPQLRVTGELPVGPLRLALQGAVLSPGSGESQNAIEADPADIAERTRRPFVEGRVRARWGAEDAQGEIGLGAHRGWFGVSRFGITGQEARIVGNAVAVTARVPLAPLLPWLELRGEAYRGRGLRGLGGGGIGQNFAVNAFGQLPVLIDDRGWWWQANARPWSSFGVGGGCGVDDPEDDPHPSGGRLRNTQCEGHVIVRPGSSVFVGLEFRRMSTVYPAGERRNDHLNLATGFEW